MPTAAGEPPAFADPAAIEALVRGDQADPFSLLGMHEHAGGVVVRTFQPQASRVWLIDGRNGSRVAELSRAHGEGIFAGHLPDAGRFPYRLRLEVEGSIVDLDDPYRFPPLLGELDSYLIAEGRHLELYRVLGAHPREVEGIAGTSFAVWAPNAQRVSVVGAFNSWDGRRHPMRRRVECGVWELFVPGLGPGVIYKYEIQGADSQGLPLKADPVGFLAELSPHTASVVQGLPDRGWQDETWMAARQSSQVRSAPISIYECHLGSWMRVAEDGNRYLSYRELAERLVPYVRDMGFTHLELLPVSEHPFDGSWGYQPIGLFAPTSRFGGPEDFAGFIDACHQAGVAVLLDWVPGHFPTDAHGLGYFDGTHFYEHADPRQGFHLDWNTMIYNYGRREVANYLFSNALFWLDRYHIDGLRVDAVASMLYLDYSRAAGQWIPNRYGGNENLEAIEFLKQMNLLLFDRHPGATSFAEESTAWTGVSQPVYLGGLGFGYKWNMGWMHDTLRYMSREPIYRKYHHSDLTFGLHYAFSENFVLPLSHDEVVHGKGSLLGKMPNDRWQKFANLRAYYAFMWTHPGKKLLFMGGEFAQEREWNHDASLDWHLLDDPFHKGVQSLVRDLNGLYRALSALHELDCESAGFQWIDANDSDNCVLAYLRLGREPGDIAVVVCNLTPLPRQNYRLGVPRPGWYRELVNTDAVIYGGSNIGNGGGVAADPVAWHGREFSLNLTLPPLATLILRPEPVPHDS